MGDQSANGVASDAEDGPTAINMRPPDIEQDMKEMDRRKRVEMIMNSQVFREELERIVENQLKEGYTPSNIAAIQQMTELLLPHSQRSAASAPTGAARCLLPINDVRGVDGLRYVKTEKLLRCKMAALCRLIEAYGWTGSSTFNHITVRITQDQEHFLVNPYGLFYHEVTASSLVKVDMQGNVIDPGTTTFGFSKPAFAVHAAIHANRPDMKCILHCQYAPVVSVSSMRQGVLPLSADAVVLGEVSVVPVSADTREMVRLLGPSNKLLMVRNQGCWIGGDSVEEAFHLLSCLIAACEQQMKLVPIGLDNLSLLSEEEQRTLREERARGAWGKVDDAAVPGADEDKERADLKDKQKRLRPADLVFEAHMRMLDNSGFRTGYIYRQPLLRNEQPRMKNDVEVPPSASSIGQYLEEDKWLSPLKKLLDGKKTQDKMRWVNSPNSYQKVEVLETGTTDPKKITKWVQEGGSPTHHPMTAVKIDTSHQFIPPNTDPAEFKRKQKELKANRMNAKVTAGPQSNILEGHTWEEIKQMQDAINQQSGGDQVVLVGAASKGIIQRDFQHNAMVYKSAYAKNPFDNVSDKELEEYKRLIEKKQRGEPIDDDIPENIRHLLVEPAVQPDHSTPMKPSSPLQSPSDEEDSSKSSAVVKRSMSARLAAEAAEEERSARHLGRRTFSERSKTKNRDRVNGSGDDKTRGAESGDESHASRISKDASSPTKESKKKKEKKEKKEKSGGLSTSSFFKKKKHKKDEKEKGASEA